MKLKYEFEYVEIDDEIMCVPIGENANQFHGMIKINDVSKEMLEIINECNNPNEVLDKMLQRHPEENKDELGNYLCEFLNTLIKEGILEP